MASLPDPVVLRVKRKRNEAPIDTIEIKRRKKEDDKEDAPAKIIFKRNRENDPKGNNAKEATKRKRTDDDDDKEKEKEDSRKKFKVVDREGKVIRLERDREEHVTCNGVEMVRDNVTEKKKDEDDDYVYDEYFAADGDSGGYFSSDGLADAEYLVREYIDGDDAEMSLVYRDTNAKDDDENEGEDSDSNDEDNWRNEYPDESDEEYNEYAYENDGEDGGDFGLGRKLKLAEEDDFDEMEDEEGVVHHKTAENSEAANLHGSSYARFKEKVLRDLHPEMYEEEDNLDRDDDDDLAAIGDE
jgi:hypothetical protein